MGAGPETETPTDDGVLSGPVMDVLPTLLAEGRTQEVLAAVAVLVARNETLERQFAELMRRRMKPNEGLSSAQLSLVLDDLRKLGEGRPLDDDPSPPAESDEDLRAHAEAATERARAQALAAAKDPKAKPRRQKLPESLPRIENVIEVPAEERACPKCGEERTTIGHVESEVLEFEPARLTVRRDMREKLACQPCEGEVVCAPRGAKVGRGGQFGCSVVAQICTAKYDLGLPLHRQRKEFKRMGLEVNASTLADQVKYAAALLEVLWTEACAQALASEMMHIDGTGVKVLARNSAKGKKLGSLWAVVGANADGPEVAAYYYASTKKGRAQRPNELGPVDILAMRKGLTVSDADTLFKSQRERDDMPMAGCNMHARRYFVKALDGGDKRAGLVLGAFKGMYQVEDDVRGASPAARLSARRERTTPIYDDIVKWCRAYEPETPPASPLGKAIGYLLRHQLALRRFEGDGVIPIDNMAAEHAFVPVALARKNFLFFGHDNGGDRAAIIFTMIRCCRIAGVEPLEYLTDVLGTLATGVDERDVPALMPAAWKLRRPR